jgi:hypothetical protein
MSAALTSVTFASAAVVGGMGAFILFDQVRMGRNINILKGGGFMGWAFFGLGSALATSGDSPRLNKVNLFHYR